MKNSILVLGVIASAGIGFFHQGTTSATAIAYTATDEDGEPEEVKTGKGRK